MTVFKKYMLRSGFLFLFGLIFKTGFSEPAASGDENKVVNEIYSETYHFHFQKVDSLILSYDKQNINNLEYNLAVVNYYWWRLISGEKNGRFSEMVSKRIETVRSGYPEVKTGRTDEQLFHLLSIYAYSARVSLIDYSYYSALTDLSRYYSLIKLSFGREELYNPFHLTSGLYYFFAGYAKEKMPLLSPVLYYYTPGNMEKGIQYLKIAEVSDDWKISQEAKYFLMKINFDVYKNYTEAAKYCNQLLAMYPENLLFQLYIFRISLSLEQVTYAKARLAMMERTASSNNQLTPDEKQSYTREAKKELDAYYKKKK